MALEAERRSFEFYRDALARVADHAVAYLFRQLMEEETEHVALLAAKLDRLQAAGSAAPARPARARIGPPPGPVPDTARLEAVLQRFDAATQLVVRRVLVEGVAAEVVAASLGVSRRTVTRKLDRFLAAARRELPAAP